MTYTLYDANGRPAGRRAASEPAGGQLGDATPAGSPNAVDRLDALLGAKLVARLNDAAHAMRDVRTCEADPSFEGHLASLEARCALSAISEDIAERLLERRRALRSGEDDAPP